MIIDYRHPVDKGTHEKEIQPSTTPVSDFSRWLYREVYVEIVSEF